MFAVALDGPSGAGKSSIAKAAAKELGFVYVDTGALYRSIGWYALEQGVFPGDLEKVEPLLAQIHLELKYEGGEQRVYLNGQELSGKIRTPEVSMAASQVSPLPPVRRFLFDLQRNMAQISNVIMDGRDIGTVVLPNATLKLFLTASPEDRARRRCQELLEKGVQVTYDEVLADVQKRDYNDSHRAEAPLRQAEDALLVDTTGNSLEQSITQISGILLEKLPQLQKKEARNVL